MKTTLKFKQEDSNVIPLHESLKSVSKVDDVLIQIDNSPDYSDDIRARETENIYTNDVAAHTFWSYHLLTFLH